MYRFAATARFSDDSREIKSARRIGGWITEAIEDTKEETRTKGVRKGTFHAP